MSILKIKDSSGNWIPIPAIKGEPGDDYVLTAADKAEIAGLLIDDTAMGDTDKTWSSDKIENELDSKISDVKVNGTSIVDAQGNANIPIAGNNIVGAISVNGDGLAVVSNGARLRCNPPTSARVKEGTMLYAPIDPYRQHESVFYGLAKVAGSDEKNSTLPVGQYTDAAKIAIQKMLGVYEAPWELIREDTGTNATPADIIVTADANGQSFELTDIRLVFYTPVQDTEAVVGDYGRVYFYYGSGSTQRDILYMGSYTQAAQASTKVSALQILQNNGMIERTMWKNITANSERTPISVLNGNLGTNTLWEMTEKTYTKMLISTITGAWSYKLYGKRKWQ